MSPPQPSPPPHPAKKPHIKSLRVLIVFEVVGQNKTNNSLAYYVMLDEIPADKTVES